MTFRRIIAVVTTFAPEEDLRTNIARVATQVRHVVIVDDGASASNREKLAAWFGNNPDVTVVSLDKNSGIAVALNTGVKIAKSMGADAVLTLDDDSLIGLHLVEGLVRHFERLSLSMRVGLIAAGWSDGGVVPDLAEIEGASSRIVRNLITSGCLMPVAAFDAAGGFREDFFIDSVDFDMCFRMRRAGYQSVSVNFIGVMHQLGEPRSRRFFGFKIESTNHSPLRRYYAVRNSMVLAAEHLFDDPAYALAVPVWWTLTLGKILVVEHDRPKKLSLMLRGLVHAVVGRTGKL